MVEIKGSPGTGAQGTDGPDESLLPGYTDSNGDEIDGNDSILAGGTGNDDVIYDMNGPNQTGNDTSGDDSSGDDTSGDDSSGDDSSGDDSSGDDTSGDDTSGDDTSGDDSSGDDSSGDDTSGDDSSGDDTSGDGTGGNGTGGTGGTICFTPNTLIATPTGERLVQDLKVGDRVITRDNGIQEIRWVGQRPLKGAELERNPSLKPVLVRQGSLGNGLPERDMLLSPNHRVLVANDKTTLFFEEREVLVAAKYLTGLAGVDVVSVTSTAYIHFLFDQHEVVLSDGAWTESFQPGDFSLKGIGAAQRDEIFELFPELKTREGVDSYHAARRSLKKHEAQVLFM